MGSAREWGDPRSSLGREADPIPGTLVLFDRGLIASSSGTAAARTIDLTREWVVSRQAVTKRKQKILLELRWQVGIP